MATDVSTLFNPVAAGYARARPDYPDTLIRYAAGLPTLRQHALDLATGNGQAALALAGYFDQVTGCDVSPAQLAHARPHDRVRYLRCRAETLPLKDHSVDLVTVAQAWHWFDGQAVEQELLRILRPGGAVVILGYVLARVDDAVDERVRWYHDELLGPYWAPERNDLLAGYPAFPALLEPVPSPRFTMSCQWTRDQFLDYLDSWSAAIAYRADRGENPLYHIREALEPIWPAEAVRTVRWPLVVKAARLPSGTD